MKKLLLSVAALGCFTLLMALALSGASCQERTSAPARQPVGKWVLTGVVINRTLTAVPDSLVGSAYVVFGPDGKFSAKTPVNLFQADLETSTPGKLEFSNRSITEVNNPFGWGKQFEGLLAAKGGLRYELKSTTLRFYSSEENKAIFNKSNP